MSLAQWAHADPQKAAAKDAARALPPSKHGVEVPFPFIDRSFYKDHIPSDVVRAAIKAALIVDVPLDGLYGIQHSVKEDRVEGFIDYPDAIPSGSLDPEHGGPVDFPIVIEYGGTRAIYDGHHRATAAMLSGEKSIRARFVNFDDPSTLSK